jgi:hypothetical protein
VWNICNLDKWSTALCLNWTTEEPISGHHIVQVAVWLSTYQQLPADSSPVTQLAAFAPDTALRWINWLWLQGPIQRPQLPHHKHPVCGTDCILWKTDFSYRGTLSLHPVNIFVSVKKPVTKSARNEGCVSVVQTVRREGTQDYTPLSSEQFHFKNFRISIKLCFGILEYRFKLILDRIGRPALRNK